MTPRFWPKQLYMVVPFFNMENTKKWIFQRGESQLLFWICKMSSDIQVEMLNSQLYIPV